MPGPARSITVAMDATPLLGVRTGVGESVAGFMSAVSTDPGIEVIGYGLSATAGKALPDRLPGPVRAARRIPIPADALLRSWARFDHPAVERWTGPVDVVHGTNFVVPPSRKAARLVTVHDLTPVRFPELCSPTSLRYPGLVRRAVDAGCLHPYGVPIHGGRCHGPLPYRWRSGARHPQRADSAATSPLS